MLIVGIQITIAVSRQWKYRSRFSRFVSGTRGTRGDRTGAEGPRSVTVTPPASIPPQEPPRAWCHPIGQPHGPTCLFLATVIPFPSSDVRVHAAHQLRQLSTASHSRRHSHVPAAAGGSSCSSRRPAEFHQRGVTAFFRVALAVTATADVELRGAVQTGAAGKWRPFFINLVH